MIKLVYSVYLIINKSAQTFSVKKLLWNFGQKCFSKERSKHIILIDWAHALFQKHKHTRTYAQTYTHTWTNMYTHICTNIRAYMHKHIMGIILEKEIYVQAYSNTITSVEWNSHRYCVLNCYECLHIQCLTNNTRQ